MIAVRGGAGLGDALYVQAIARHLAKDGSVVEACTNYPDVFLPLGHNVICSPFRRERIDRVAHYSMRRHIRDTDQFTDCCIQAGIRGPVDLRLDWEAQPNTETVAHLRAVKRRLGRQIVAVALPREPMDRTDGYGRDLLPDLSVIQRALDILAPTSYIVQLGAGSGVLGRYSGIDLDLANKTTVEQMLDAAACADLFVGHVSFFVPLAESLGVPALFAWSRRGLQSKNEIIRWLTPAKVFHAKRLMRAVIDDCSADELSGAVDEVRQLGYSSRAA